MANFATALLLHSQVRLWTYMHLRHIYIYALTCTSHGTDDGNFCHGPASALPSKFSTPLLLHSQVRLWDGLAMGRGPLAVWEDTSRGCFNAQATQVRRWTLF